MVLLLVLADIAAEGFALCSLSFARQPISGWNTATGCYYNTSKPAYQPPWCSWSGVSCNAAHSINILQVYNVYWDTNSNYLTQNNLKRTIPSSIGALKGLTYLYFDNMGYTGTIPSALFTLTKLNTLYLQSHSLSGLIPSGLAKLKLLNTLSLFNNQLNGTLPAIIFQFPQLSYLNLEYNSFHGTLPTINKNTALQNLYMNFNRLSGNIAALGNLTNLHSLGLTNNARQTCGYKIVNQNSVYSCTSVGGFNGSLPASISSLSNLQDLRVSGNKLSGTISSSFSSLMNLYSVSFDSNRFSGTIPQIFGNMRLAGGIYQMLLHNNYFSGSIPSMPYSYPQFIFTFDQNCQLTSAYPAVILSSQSQCKGANAYPSPSPTPCKDVLC